MVIDHGALDLPILEKDYGLISNQFKVNWTKDLLSTNKNKETELVKEFCRILLIFETPSLQT